MSKFSKLMRDPKQFVVDSQVYRRYKLMTNRTPLIAGKQPPRFTPSSADAETQLGELISALAEAVPLLDVTDAHTRVLATRREESYLLSEFLHELGHDGRAEVILEQGKRRLDVAGAGLFSIDAFVLRSGWFSMSVKLPKGPLLRLEVEFWDDEDNQVAGPRRNAVARRISKHTVEEHGLFQRGRLCRARDLYPAPLVDETDFPIDIVYTWVNHLDPGWKELRKSVADEHPFVDKQDAGSLDRFLNRDELRFSLRSVAQFAPWVRRIHVVTNCAPPDWLDLSHPKIRWVQHEAILPAEALPTFNSHAIEARLQHVPDLAEHFLYFNDDFFLLRPTAKKEFFHSNGLSRSFMEQYATINGAVHVDDPDYMNAARNGTRLMERHFGRSAAELHRHTPYALRKDVLLEMEERFEEIRATAHNAFRTPEDISTVSFLYHHYAYWTGRGAYSSSDAVLLKPRTPNYERKMVDIFERRSPPISMCLNDGGGSAGVSHWGRHVVEYLEAWFPEPCEFETSLSKRASSADMTQVG